MKQAQEAPSKAEEKTAQALNQPNNMNSQIVSKVIPGQLLTDHYLKEMELGFSRESNDFVEELKTIGKEQELLSHLQDAFKQAQENLEQQRGDIEKKWHYLNQMTGFHHKKKDDFNKRYSRFTNISKELQDIYSLIPKPNPKLPSINVAKSSALELPGAALERQIFPTDASLDFECEQFFNFSEESQSKLMTQSREGYHAYTRVATLAEEEKKTPSPQPVKKVKLNSQDTGLENKAQKNKQSSDSKLTEQITSRIPDPVFSVDQNHETTFKETTSFKNNTKLDFTNSQNFFSQKPIDEKKSMSRSNRHDKKL